MVKIRPHKIINGEPKEYRFHHGYFEQCCSCGFVHFVIPKPMRGGVKITVYRDDWQTRKARGKK